MRMIRYRRRLGSASFVAALALALGMGAMASPALAAAGGAPEGPGMLKALQNDAVLPSVTPPDYDVTVVVFSDYQCPYCRKLHGALKEVLRQDRKVRVVYRDWPIFGAASVEAARSAMAARYQGKHAAFNDALMATSGRLDSPAIQSAAQRAGLDMRRLKSDLATHKAEIDGALARTAHYAEALGIAGTPAMVVGSYLLPGAATAEMLGKAIAIARKPA